MECLELEQTITDTKIASFFNRDDPFRSGSSTMMNIERRDRVINADGDYYDVMVLSYVVANLA